MKQPTQLRLKVPLALAAISIGIAPSLYSQTVAWGTSILDDPSIYNSSGAASPGYTWTVGYFNPLFTPTSANATQWFANYNIVGTSPEITGGGDIYGVSGSTSFASDATAVGNQIYILAFNSSSLLGLPGGEALLFTQPGLTFPGSNTVTLDIANDPGSTADDPFTVVWGRVDRTYGTAGGVLTGGGVFTSLPADNAFEAQFGTFIPEPSAAALAMVGAAVMLRRRRVG